MRGGLTSLFMLSWMSVLMAIVHLGIHDRTAIVKAVFAASESACLLAGMVEAGCLESGIHTAWRRATQMAAVIASIGYLAFISVS